jgi:hypothetical protein
MERYDPFDGGLGFSLATRVGTLPTSTSIGVSKLLLPDHRVEVKLTAALPD